MKDTTLPKLLKNKKSSPSVNNDSLKDEMPHAETLLPPPPILSNHNAHDVS